MKSLLKTDIYEIQCFRNDIIVISSDGLNDKVSSQEILELFRSVYGRDRAKRWMRRWRMFFMACEELFAYAGGEEWFVGHYLLEKSN